MRHCTDGTCDSGQPCSVCRARAGGPLGPKGPLEQVRVRSCASIGGSYARSTVAGHSRHARNTWGSKETRHSRTRAPLLGNWALKSVGSIGAADVSGAVRSVPNPPAGTSESRPSPAPRSPDPGPNRIHIGTATNAPLYPTIQDAIDAAKDGETVFVGWGTYAGRGNRDITFKGKKITVTSESGPDTCIVDVEAKSGHRGFLFKDGERPESSRLVGITIRNGRDQDGAGIKCIGDESKVMGSPTIENCIIRDCKSTKKGGGVYCSKNSGPVLVGCSILECTAGDQGGGIAIEGPLLDTGEFKTPGDTPLAPQVRLEDCTIANNVAGKSGGGAWVDRDTVSRFAQCTLTANKSEESGGGVGVYGSSVVTFDSCDIHRNLAKVDGGGLWSDGDSNPRLIGCTVSENVAWRFGAGAYLRDSLVGHVGLLGAQPPWTNVPQFTRCRVVSNTVGAMGGAGGGLYVTTSSRVPRAGVVFNHGFIVDNRAPRGGGVFVVVGTAYINNSVVNRNEAITGSASGDGGAACVSAPSGRLEIVLSTLYGNSAQRDGGCVYLDGGGVSVSASLIWNSVDAVSLRSWIATNPAKTASIYLEYSNVGYDGIASPAGMALGAGPGNATVAPGFLPAVEQPGGVVYRIGTQSPVRDGRKIFIVYSPGAPLGVGEAFLPWCVDIDGGARWGGTSPGIGAYEVQEPVPAGHRIEYCTYGAS